MLNLVQIKFWSGRSTCLIQEGRKGRMSLKLLPLCLMHSKNSGRKFKHDEDHNRYLKPETSVDIHFSLEKF